LYTDKQLLVQDNKIVILFFSVMNKSFLISNCVYSRGLDITLYRRMRTYPFLYKEVRLTWLDNYKQKHTYTLWTVNRSSTLHDCVCHVYQVYSRTWYWLCHFIFYLHLVLLELHLY